MMHSQNRAPGPAGIPRLGLSRPVAQESTQARHNFSSAASQSVAIAQTPKTDATTLGGYLYAITGGVHEKELIAIAQVILRRASVQGYAGLAAYFTSRDALQLGIQRNHPRLLAFESASISERTAHPGMLRAIDSARKVLQGNVPDLTRGAWFWEGPSLRQGGIRHPRFLAGIRFTQPSHNLYHLPDASRSMLLRTQQVETRAQRDALIAFETTAAWGSSTFFRHPLAWLRANGIQPWKEYV